MSLVKSVVVMAGGTGGHVFPALAVAKQLAEQGVAVHWLGTRNGIEADVVPKAGFEMTYLNVTGLRGNGIKPLVKAPWKLVRSVFAAMTVLRRVKADAVIGLGGYVTGPGGVAAKLMCVPLYIHEQNAVAGMTNKLLARMAQRILLGFPGAFPAGDDTVWVGNPVRQDILTLAAPAQRYGSRQGPIRLLILGGSLGATALNEMVPAAIALLPEAQRPEVRHQAGRRHVESAQAHYLAAGVDATVTAFVDDMAEAYGWADLVICRSGALTVAELAAAGVASVLVPFPHAVDDHQTANAQFLSDAGAAVLCQQRDLSAERLAEQLQGLMQRSYLLSMAEAAHHLAKADATALVVETVLRGKA